MKRYITIIIALVALHSTSMAQNRVGVKIDVRALEYVADSVKIDINFDLAELKVGLNESVVFEPTMFKDDMTRYLPTLVVRRRGGAKSYKRAITLGYADNRERYEEWYGEPLDIIEFYGREKQESYSYTLTLPYESWMVDSELYVDCTTCGCCNTEDSGTIIPDSNSLNIDIASVDAYDVMPDVELIKPEKVAIKRRDIAYSSALIFKVNSTYIDPNLAGNQAELESIDEMMQSVISDSDYTITKINIIGFASPEGRLESNMRLSKGRATALESLMKRKYKMISPELYSVEFGGENWDKLSELVAESDMAERDQVLDIIKNVSIDEGRETKIMQLNGGRTYSYMLKNMFPATRLVVVDVEYNIDAYDLVRIGELIDTKPQNLSLEEMYRLSETYTMQDSEFEKIFLTAVKVFPNDEVAQNNALVTEIRNGNHISLDSLVANIDKNTESAELANSLGAYYMLLGDYDVAEQMLTRASELGSIRAEKNKIELDKKLENLRLIKESEEFREKIYGK